MYISNSLRNGKIVGEVSAKANKLKLGFVRYLNLIGEIKFILGVLLIIHNFILGKAALVILPLNPALSFVIYIISWGMLFGGIALCGKKGWYVVKRLYVKYGRRVIEYLKKS